MGTKVINEKCWTKDIDGKREVSVNWSLFLSYPTEDAPSRRFTAACLARSGVASKTKVAEAFGYHRNYVAELGNRLESRGLEGMLEGKRGPKGPNKLHRQMRRRARELRRQGKSLQSIAKQLQKEWRVSISHTSVRGMVIEVETEENDGKQASLDGAWPLAMPLGIVEAMPSATLEASVSSEQSAEAVTIAKKVEEQPAQPVEPKFTEDREFSGAGGFLHYAALAALGLVDVFQKVYRGLACRHYGLREFVLTLFFLCVTGFPSLESLKRPQRRDLGCLIGASRSPIVKTAQRKLQDLVEQKPGHRLVIY